jgi:hypothetical protein
MAIEGLGMSVDEYIAKKKGEGARVQSVQIPGSRAQDDILIETGTTPLAPPSPAGRGQIDSTVYLSRVTEEPRKPSPPKPASQINVDHVEALDSAFELGSTGMILRETHITGWERVHSHDVGDYQLVMPDGTVESNSSAIVVRLFKELKSRAQGKKK